MNVTKQLNTADQGFYDINPKHKDCLFRLTFREKEDLLDLYNAVNDTDYQNPEELTVYTLEDVVYISIKNDISFLFGEMLNLYEHQSTRNPNMPMRGLLYFARNYESYIEQNNMNMYGSVLQKFPLPQYYIFYNGSDTEPDRKEMSLDDAFYKIEGKESYLNCKAVLLNINYGHNAALMEKCRCLHDYATFIHYIRRNQAGGMSLLDAVNLAIDDCIKEGILKDLLIKCRGEVRSLVLSSFNREIYERDLKAEGWSAGKAEGFAEGLAEGHAEGRTEGETIKLIQLICKKLLKNKSPEIIAEELEEDIPVIQEICKIAANYSPEYDYELIYEQLKQRTWN